MFGWLRRKAEAPDPVEPAATAAALPALPVETGPLFPYTAPPRRITAALPIIWVPDTPPPCVSLASLDPAPEVLAQAEGGMAAIALARLPPGTVVFGGGHFVTGCFDAYLAEQFPHDDATDHHSADAIAPLELPVEEIADETLLIGRYGIGRFDTWLIALLPKLLLAERAFPGRFRFLLPHALLQERPEPHWAQVVETLRAAGITAGRIRAADPAVSMRFRALFAVSPVWASDHLHPAAGAALRAVWAEVAPAMRRRVAVIDDPAGDDHEIADAAAGRGFEIIAWKDMTIAQRVAAFKGAAVILADGRTDMSLLAFAPLGVQVVRVADARDAYAEGLVREREGVLISLAAHPGQEAWGAAMDSLPR